MPYHVAMKGRQHFSTKLVSCDEKPQGI